MSPKLPAGDLVRDLETDEREVKIQELKNVMVTIETLLLMFLFLDLGINSCWKSSEVCGKACQRNVNQRKMNHHDAKGLHPVRQE